MSASKIILLGGQPSSHLTLGNYLGALRNWVSLQDDPQAECLYMIADLHAITQSGHAPSRPRRIAHSVAGGIDPKRSTLFVQSTAIPAHAELNWLLSSMAQMGKLERMTQFKDKAGKECRARAAWIVLLSRFDGSRYFDL